MSAARRPRVLVDGGSASASLTRAVTQAVRRTLEVEERDDGEISLALLGDEDMRSLNHRFLGKDRTTDVLAFALGEEGEVIGDVYVGYEQAQRQAAELGIPIEEELVRLTVHGTLHVLGHDHPEGPDRVESPMFRLQERIVRELIVSRRSE